jgi:ABC-2 type transport system ATP-binding protein
MTLSVSFDAIEAAGLRMRYGAKDVLHGLDLGISRGEVVCLLGPNGAGKSTTVEILEGFRRRSAGRVRVLGTDPAEAGDAWRARIGVVLQSWRDHARWRVRELLVHIGAHYPDPWDADALLATVGLTAQATQKVRTLSGGQRRRLDVAIGLVGKPELLFLDEPTTGLDPVARRGFHELIGVLAADRATTILLTTHDLAEAERLGSRVLVLDRGRVIADGTPAELAERHGGEPVWMLKRPSLEDAYLALMNTAEGGS